MLRPNVGVDIPIHNKRSSTKIRKPGSLSSGTSSSRRRFWFKRAVSVGGRRRGTSWKSNTRSRCSSTNMSVSCQNQHFYGLTEGLHSSASARKLVNAFCQVNKAPSSKMSSVLDNKLFEKESRRENDFVDRSLVRHTSMSQEPNGPRSRRKVSEMDEKRSWYNEQGHWFSDMKSNPSEMEVPICTQDLSLVCSEAKTYRLNDLQNSLIASKELIKVLIHIMGPHSSTVSLLSALRGELNVARVHVKHLIKEQGIDGTEIHNFKKLLADEMEAWKNKQKEKVRSTVELIVKELENEKKLRKRAERLNKKLGAALAKTEASLQYANKEFERERKSRERVERICNELVRGVGEDKAEVEELMRETAKVQEELEKEREMLKLSDELREERVQMKLLEARFQFEEKNAAIDQLRNELEAFLATKKAEQLAANQIFVCDQKESSNKEDREDNGDAISEGSDMHSIELNMNGNSKSYSWSYATSSKGGKTTVALPKENHDMTENCRNLSRPGFSSDAGILEGNMWADNQKFQEQDEELDGEWDEGDSNLLDTEIQDLDHDAERYQAIKNLRDQMLAGSRFTLPQDKGDGAYGEQ